MVDMSPRVPGPEHPMASRAATIILVLVYLAKERVGISTLLEQNYMPRRY